MPKSGGRDVEKERLWRRLLLEFSKSGLSQAAFCKSKNVSPHQLGYWRAELQKRDSENIVTPVRKEEPSVFLPLRVTDQVAAAKVMEIRCRDGIVIQIPENVSADTFVLVGKLIKKLKC